MDEQNEQNAPVQVRNPNALAQAMARVVVENKLAKPVLPRRLVTFLMDASACLPGLFEDDFEITIGGLTAEMELEAAQAAKGQVATLAFHYARLSLVAVNGKALDKGKLEDEFLWQALGTGGRQIVAGMFAEACMPDEVAQGKARRTLRVSG